MTYAIRGKGDNLIAFSNDLDYIYKYLQDYYRRDFTSVYNYQSDKPDSEVKIQITITKVEDDSELYRNFDEFEIIPFYGDIMLTVWEFCECERLFNEYQYNLLMIIENLARDKLKRVYDEVTNDDIHAYMRRNLSDKYCTLLSPERFMMELGVDKIREMVNKWSLSLDTFRSLNKEYIDKINMTDS